jgi:hypothetical protein
VAKRLRANGREVAVWPEDRIEGFSVAELHGLLGPRLQIFFLDVTWVLVHSLPENSSSRKLRTNRQATDLALGALLVRHKVPKIKGIRGDALLAKLCEIQIRDVKEHVRVW